MTKLVQPVVSIPFKLSNGVSLKATARVRMIKSSHRVDAKAIGIDWNTIYVDISLNAGEEEITLVRASLDACSLDDDKAYLDKKILPLAVSLGSTDYFHILQNTLMLAVHNVKQLKKD